MKTRFRAWYLIPLVLVLAGGGVAAWLVGVSSQGTGTVSGLVRDASGPVPGAHVRVRATENLTFTLTDGTFTLEDLAEGVKIEVAAWYQGYYIASTYVTPTASAITLTLRPYHTTDNPDYDWVSPEPGGTTLTLSL